MSSLITWGSSIQLQETLRDASKVQKSLGKSWQWVKAYYYLVCVSMCTQVGNHWQNCLPEEINWKLFHSISASRDITGKLLWLQWEQDLSISLPRRRFSWKWSWTMKPLSCLQKLQSPFSKLCTYRHWDSHLTKCPHRLERFRRGSHTHHHMTTTPRFPDSACKRHRNLKGCQCKPQVRPLQCWNDPHLHAFQSCTLRPPQEKGGTKECTFALRKKKGPTALLKHLLKQFMIRFSARHFVTIY